ncbi:uncharacterized protein CDAR_470511 [Caerostris darwini]|uniref:THAP-type domain-containing protein n=1 Tax=Caerostris darwini TaxID=1538125 RepID=A0AAV4VHA7_9ARAC|nr:uncharacterized protein CDAR_470511 [Caerostris darwini]
MPYTCCVPICRANLKSGPKVTVFKFPTDEVQKLKWIAAIRRKDFIPSKNSRVCKMHFLESDIIAEAHGYDEKTGKRLVAPLQVCRLKNDAIPKVFPGYPDYLTKNISPRSKKLEYNAKKEDDGDDEDDEIVLEPTVIIKEEPIEFDPDPSTSSAHSDIKEEFILPNEENTSSAEVPLSSAEESTPKLTLPVACLESSREPDGDQQVQLKRRISPSSVSPSLTKRLRPYSGNDVLSDAVQNPLYNLDEYFNIASSKDSGKAKDEFDVFGEYIAAKLRSLDRRSCAYAQKGIGDILFDAETKKYAMEEVDQC